MIPVDAARAIYDKIGALLSHLSAASAHETRNLIGPRSDSDGSRPAGTDTHAPARLHSHAGKMEPSVQPHRGARSRADDPASSARQPVGVVVVEGPARAR